jgi:hypothetical protein
MMGFYGGLLDVFWVGQADCQNKELWNVSRGFNIRKGMPTLYQARHTLYKPYSNKTLYSRS